MASRIVVPVVLSAGDSSRMGHPKALLPLGPDTFLNRILGILERLGLADTVLILGRDAPRIRRSIVTNRPPAVIINHEPERGQLSSIQLALAALPPATAGCMIWPVDQPLVSETLVRDLIGLFHRSRARITLPLCGNRTGHPAIFHRELFQELLDAAPQGGAKQIVLRHAGETAHLPTEEIGVVEDIDTPEDYRRLTGRSLEEALAGREPTGD